MIINIIKKETYGIGDKLLLLEDIETNEYIITKYHEFIVESYNPRVGYILTDDDGFKIKRAMLNKFVKKL